MPQMLEMDKNVTLRDRLQHAVGPVIVINTFAVQNGWTTRGHANRT